MTSLYNPPVNHCVDGNYPQMKLWAFKTETSPEAVHSPGANLEVKSNCSFQPLLPASQVSRRECVDAGLPRCKPQLRPHILLDRATSEPAENPLGSPFFLPFPSAWPHSVVLTGENAGANCFKCCTGILQIWLISFFLKLIHQEKLFLIESYFSKKISPPLVHSQNLFYLYFKTHFLPVFKTAPKHR